MAKRKFALPDQNNYLFGYLRVTYDGALDNGITPEMLDAALCILSSEMLFFQDTRFSNKSTVNAVAFEYDVIARILQVEYPGSIQACATRGGRGSGGGSRRAGANNNNSNAGNNNNNAGNNNANAAEQQAVAAALAEVNAGDPAEAANYQNVRNAFTTNGGFPNAVGGVTDKFLLSAGGIFLDQQTLARSAPNEIDAAVTAHNRQNKGFGQGITPQHSAFLHGFAHVFRLERSGGRPLDRARLQALVPTLTSQTIIDAGEKLKEVQEIKEGPQPQFDEMVLGEGFYQWQIAFQTMLSSVIGAYWIPIVYLTVPLVINTANIDHVMWAAVPLLGIAYNRDNAMFYRILQPIVAKSKYKAFLLEFRGGQDGRRLWLKILSMEMSEGNRHQIVANLKKIFSTVYDGKSANLTFLTWYTALKSAYQAMHDNREPTTSYTRIENTMKKMCLKDFPSLQATIAAVRVKHQNGDWDKFIEDCLLHISRHEIEANAGSKPFPRTIAQVTPDKRKHEAASSTESTAAINKRARKKKHGDEDAHSDDDRDVDGDDAKDRKIKALVARIEALEGDKEEKGSTTGAGIAGSRGK
ncbi:hypothetical protein THAOC_29340 [Thalassiosira oceanica]|uniref:Uncharacterized protein n=1 Tax=Thalassiosira oceanica TaxID=159749 RepID=K0RXL5_THAOC|nr:hypothetical protein THAOC_29340 [Thalassiosira oceanica]|eukprot:EJK51482.1 hypothetical protein THAOC_29340 [Thalassiosira oceanica]